MLVANYIPFWGLVNILQDVLDMIDKIKKLFGVKFNRLISLGIWILIVLLVFSVIRNLGKVGGVKREIQAEKDKVAKLKTENSTLMAKIQESQTQFFIEKEMRDKLGLAKEGEAVVVLPDAETLKGLAPVIEASEENLPDPIWKKWINLFF